VAPTKGVAEDHLAPPIDSSQLGNQRSGPPFRALPNVNRLASPRGRAARRSSILPRRGPSRLQCTTSTGTPHETLTVATPSEWRSRRPRKPVLPWRRRFHSAQASADAAVGVDDRQAAARPWPWGGLDERQEPAGRMSIDRFKDRPIAMGFCPCFSRQLRSAAWGMAQSSAGLVEGAGFGQRSPPGARAASLRPIRSSAGDSSPQA